MAVHRIRKKNIKCHQLLLQNIGGVSMISIKRKYVLLLSLHNFSRTCFNLSHFSKCSQRYDFIFGSDLAYRDHLHDPLISSFLQLSHKFTIILIGVTMNDTRPVFFDKLTAAGFLYERLADHFLEGAFRGGNFGIFVITRR